MATSTLNDPADFRARASEMGVVADEFQLSQVDHPLARLFNSVDAAFFHDFRGLPAFDVLATVLVQKIPDIAARRELQVLYPGSGSHVAPLIAAMRLIDQGVIDRARFTFTEIKDYSDRIGMLLAEGKEQGLFDDVKVSEPIPHILSGSEQTFEITYRGKKIEIVFALNRSGEKYYRREFLKGADLVVIHDPGDGGFLADSYGLFAHMLRQKAPNLIPNLPKYCFQAIKSPVSEFVSHLNKKLRPSSDK